jgi:hypothetical protein
VKKKSRSGIVRNTTIAYARLQKGQKAGASQLNQDAAPLRFSYSAVASLGAFEA